jgi:hypothetical protein
MKLDDSLGDTINIDGRRDLYTARPSVIFFDQE